MPYLIMNMFTELLYVLEQRFLTLSISSQSRRRGVYTIRIAYLILVMNDIILGLLTDDLMQTIFQPQELYPFQFKCSLGYPSEYIKGTFEKICNSSIMKLNESSMQKVPSFVIS